jgi:hypothetical protein
MPYVDVANDRIYVASYNSGKINTYKYSDGTYLGEWQYNTTWAIGGRPAILGIYPGSTDVIMGSLYTGVTGNIYRWDVTDPTSWVQGDPLFTTAVFTAAEGSTRPYRRMAHSLNATYMRIMALDRPTLDLLGLPSTTIGWITNHPTYYGATYGARYLVLYDTSADTWTEVEVSQDCSYTRSGVKGRSSVMCCFTTIDGNAWMVYGTSGTIDHYAEEQYMRKAGGIAAMQVSPGRVEYDIQESEDFTPLKIAVELAGTVNSEQSTHPGKHRVSMFVGGIEYGPRSGDALNKLDEAISGDPAWPSVAAGTTATFRWDMHSGVLGNWDDVQGNPGDVTTENVPSGQLGPPYDVELALVTADTAEPVIPASSPRVKLIATES